VPVPSSATASVVSPSRAAAESRSEIPTVAIIPWGHVIEDFLRPHRLTIEDFCTDFTGSWVFGYAEALRAAGMCPLIVVVSNGVRRTVRRTHRATGIDMCVLPVPRRYRFLRHGMKTGYGRTVKKTFRGPPLLQIALFPLLFAAKEVAPYFDTPLRALARELERADCRLLLCQEYEFPRFDVCVALGRLRGVSVFATFQGGVDQRWWLERLTRPAAVRRSAGLIAAPAAEVARVEARYRPRAVARIANPIDLGAWRPHDRAAARRELGIDHDARVAAWHGRVQMEHKGIDTLLDAWRIVVGEPVGRERALLLVGSGPDAERVRELIEELPPDHVIWVDRYLHSREEIARLLAAADVYAFPSRHEGFAVAPLEAMACGLPLVAARVSGIPELLRDGEESGGVIVPPEDSVMLARQLKRLLDDEALARRMGTQARVRAQEYGFEPIGKELRTFFLANAETRG